MPDVLRCRPLVWLGLFLLATLPYVTAIDHPFVYDDYAQVVRNDLVRSTHPGPVLAGGSVTHGGVEWYRPLTVYSLALNYAATGLEPVSYRLVNLGVHGANTLLVLLIAKRLLPSDSAAIAAAAVFGAHAVHAEAVIPVFGRADLLAAFFVLVAWRLSLAPSFGPGRVAVAAVMFLAGLFSKENAVALLPVLFATDVAIRGGTLGATVVRIRRAFKGRWPLYLAMLSALVLYVAVRTLATGSLISTEVVRYLENPLVEAGFAARVATASWVVVEYLRLFLVPHPLTVDYSYNQIPVITRWSDPRLAAVGALVAAVVLALPFAWRKWRVAGLAMVLFGILIAPVSNLLVPIGTIMAERLLYLPSMALCLLAGTAVIRLYRRVRPPLRGVIAGAFVFVLIAHVGTTVVRSRDWSSEERLFASAVRVAPHSAKARFNHAVALVEAGQTGPAESALRAAVTIARAYPEAHNLLGTLLLARNNVAGAEHAFQSALRDAPMYPPALGNLGILRRRQGRSGEARDLLERAVEADPSMAVAHVNLGLIADMDGDYARAIRHYRRAWALDGTLDVARERAQELEGKAVR